MRTQKETDLEAEIKRLNMLGKIQADRLNEALVEIERLNTLATDAITHLTDEVGAGDDPVAFVCAAYVASRQEIHRLKGDYPEYNGITDFIECMFDYAKVVDVMDSDNATHELVVHSIWGVNDQLDRIAELEEELSEWMDSCDPGVDKLDEST